MSDAEKDQAAKQKNAKLSPFCTEEGRQAGQVQDYGGKQEENTGGFNPAADEGRKGKYRPFYGRLSGTKQCPYAEGHKEHTVSIGVWNHNPRGAQNIQGAD